MLTNRRFGGALAITLIVANGPALALGTRVALTFTLESRGVSI